MKTRKGFTLIEILVSLGIFGVIMVLVLSLQANSSQTTRLIVSQSKVQEELRYAAAIIADEVQRAIYVFPPCGIYSSGQPSTVATCDLDAPFPSDYVPNKMNVRFSKFVLGGNSGDFTRKPGASAGSTGASTWEVGSNTAPILAMITAPKNISGSCSSGSSDSCYQFVAYYPVLRSQVSRQAGSLTSSERLDPDFGNKDRWVIMEYRLSLGKGASPDIPALTVAVPGVGNINVPAISWSEVGESDGPQADPLQQTIDSIPSITANTSVSFTLAAFNSRMNSTVQNISNRACGGNCASILIPNITPVTGFQIEFPNGAIDERGVTEVRLKLQGSYFSSGVETKVPPSPIETFASPRNISY
jgi:prepilin-type N-terminal cleavage/methylation domain-containing protein